MGQLSLQQLRDAVAGRATAIRSISTLYPAGGPGDKVFPPTYVKEGRAETKYAFETRRIDGRETRAVLIDSVASQANRFEEALLDGWRRKELRFPLVLVDFSQEAGLEDLEQISALQAPHRIADALLRDSVLDGTLFRYTDVGKAFSDARVNHATGMYKYCPHAIIFGVWDSTGPKGGLGAKFQRCLVSEIVGIGAISGVKTASRIDPVGIERKAGPVYQNKDPDAAWTVYLEEAAQDKKKPVEVGKGKDKGRPASINHGNIPPTIDTEAGGVTIDYATQTTVLSLAALRRVHFTTDVRGRPLDSAQSDEANLAARTTLAALALAALVYQRENDFDLRSRCLLVPTGPLKLELLQREGTAPEVIELDKQHAVTLLDQATNAAEGVGLGWSSSPVSLQPSKKLADLIRKSRVLKIEGESENA